MKPESVDHIGIIVKNLKITNDFYSKFLGQPIISDADKVVYQIGDTKIYFKLPLQNKSFGNYDKDSISLNHLAFGVNTNDELRRFENILNESKIKNSGIKLSKIGREFVWFDDPDGYRLEFYLRNK